MMTNTTQIADQLVPEVPFSKTRNTADSANAGRTLKKLLTQILLSVSDRTSKAVYACRARHQASQGVADSLTLSEKHRLGLYDRM